MVWRKGGQGGQGGGGEEYLQHVSHVLLMRLAPSLNADEQGITQLGFDICGYENQVQRHGSLSVPGHPQ
jgi:hypothetical protein